MDETDTPQTPPELLIILAAIADEGIPIPDDCAQVYRPLQQGRGLRRRRGPVWEGISRTIWLRSPMPWSGTPLPANLKLSVHSGSDKFSIYNSIAQGLKEFDAGVHVKTAGTTWLEELIGPGGGRRQRSWRLQSRSMPTLLRMPMSCVRRTRR